MYNLLLFGTLGCHLCEEAEQLLKQWFGPNLAVTHIDVSESEQLIEQYGIRIPVVSNGVDELDWPFSRQCCEALAIAAVNDLRKTSGKVRLAKPRRVLRISTQK